MHPAAKTLTGWCIVSQMAQAEEDGKGIAPGHVPGPAKLRAHYAAMAEPGRGLPRPWRFQDADHLLGLGR